jgi:hypothetical protein
MTTSSKAASISGVGAWWGGWQQGETEGQAVLEGDRMQHDMQASSRPSHTRLQRHDDGPLCHVRPLAQELDEVLQATGKQRRTGKGEGLRPAPATAAAAAARASGPPAPHLRRARIEAVRGLI